MIVLNLSCALDHKFEGWFASLDAFDDQRSRGLVSCPACNSQEICRLPSGPRVISSTGAREAVQAVAEGREAVQLLLMDAIKSYVKDSENVGVRFSEEARKIHYKEVPLRNIRGVASLDETRELLEEGIAVLPLPFPADEEQH